MLIYCRLIKLWLFLEMSQRTTNHQFIVTFSSSNSLDGVSNKITTSG